MIASSSRSAGSSSSGADTARLQQLDDFVRRRHRIGAEEPRRYERTGGVRKADGGDGIVARQQAGAERAAKGVAGSQAGDDVDRLIAVEVLSPDGNWSSYPPHKHDNTPGSLANNEEIYYFRVGKVGSVATSDEGFALHRTYTTDGSIDETVVVRDGDAFLVPRGYHGPTVAAPGYPLYYLNVMAGPNPERTMAIVDDPPYAWVRGSWEGMAVDPRCPLTSADGAR